MIRFNLILFVLIYNVSTVASHPTPPSPKNSCFRSAVLDQVRQEDVNSIAKTIELNLDLYERAAVQAKENGAEIIVYPEDGIIFTETTRNETLTFGERLPNIPTPMCIDHFAHTHPVAYRLACIALRNQMYVESNVIDIQPCHTNITGKCPPDGLYAFNTAVFFNRNGSLLAKYHKQHLFPTETFKNVPPIEEMISIQTEIGRLGLQTCFDIIYKSPGHRLASEHKVDTMLFSTSWYDQLPFLDATQFQMSWASAHKVNLLAANIHMPQHGKKGSGIYAGAKDNFETVNRIDGKTRLLIADLPINATSDVHCSMNATILEVTQKASQISPTEAMYAFKIDLNFNAVSLAQLLPTKEELHRCFNGVCCLVNYRMDQKTLSHDDDFYLIIANRTKPGPFLIVEEFCGVVHCPRKFEPCSAMRSKFPLNSKFHYLNLYGQFGLNTTVYPSVIGSQHEVMKKNHLWKYEKVKNLPNLGDQSHKHFPDLSKQLHAILVGEKNTTNSYPIGTVGLYGRPYDRDPTFVFRPFINKVQ